MAAGARNQLHKRNMDMGKAPPPPDLVRRSWSLEALMARPPPLAPDGVACNNRQRREFRARINRPLSYIQGVG